jgi:error-prone DNA polymerase
MREKTKAEGSATSEDLQRYTGGLICLTGGDEGPLAAALVNGGEEAGREVVERLVETFGPHNVYVELQRHQEREEEWRNQAALRIADSLHLPVLATNGVRYAAAYDPDDCLRLTVSVMCVPHLRWRRSSTTFLQRLGIPSNFRRA